MDSIENIPDELLCFIFSFMDVLTLGRLSQVCKRFNTITKIDGLWLKLSTKSTLVHAKPGRCFCTRNKRKIKPDESYKRNCCLKEKSRLARLWAKEGGYLDNTLLQYKRKQRPCIHVDEHGLWISSEQSINYFEIVGKTKLRKFKDCEKKFPFHGRNSSFVGHCDYDVTKFVCYQNIIYSAHRNGDICVWNKNVNIPLVVKNMHSKDINCLDVNKNILASASDDKTVIVSKFIENNLVGGIKISTGERNWSLCLSADSERLICGSAGYVSCEPVTCWNIETGTKTCSFLSGKRGLGIYDIKFDTENTFLSSGYDGITRLWDLRSNLQKSVQSWVEPFDYSVYCFDTDGYNALFTGTSRHGMVRFWDRRKTAEHVQIYFVDRKDSPVYSLAFDVSSLYAALDHGVHQLDFSG